MNISKLHWRYAHEAYITNAFIGDQWLELRVCAHGYDENNEIQHTLYCTADGRFFHKRKDGWREILPTFPIYRKTKPKSCGGNHDCPFIRHCSNLRCHQLVCTAFYGQRPDGYECDHLNGNHLDWTAYNLEWVTPDENYRRAKCARRLRKIGVSPKWLPHWLLRHVYKFNEGDYNCFIENVKIYTANDPSPLSIGAIEKDVIKAYESIAYVRISN